MLNKITRSMIQLKYLPANYQMLATKKIIGGGNLSGDFTQLFNDNKIVPTNGRSWRAQELRLKSNEDLHKLWFICVKEKNLLLADKILEKQFTEESQLGNRIQKIRVTMKRILTVVSQRQQIRKQYRQQLQKQYIAKKKTQLQAKVQEQQKDKLPQITTEMLRAKYHELRKGIDNVQYLQRIWDKQKQTKQRKERMQARLSTKKIQPFQSFWEYQTTKIGQRPLQEQVLRTQIKNWKSLNLKQRKIILGFLNARRSKDAKNAFLKQLKILGQKIAYKEMKERVQKRNTQ